MPLPEAAAAFSGEDNPNRTAPIPMDARITASNTKLHLKQRCMEGPPARLAIMRTFRNL
jgi:hypothetical protein